MENSNVQLMELPHELLLMIFKHLDNTEMLHSLMGVNIRLDGIISDPMFTKHLTLMRLSMNNMICPLTPRKLGRFCSEILPRIDKQVKWINVDASSMEHVLLAGKYSNLFGLGIYNITEEAFQRILLDANPLGDIFKNQISSLVVSISTDGKRRLADQVSITVFEHIFDVLTNLRSLIFDSPFSYESNQRFSFKNTSSTLFSSTLLELRVSVTSFDDCLYLLNGHFNQLRTFHIKILDIKLTQTIDNQMELPNLRNFSLICYSSIHSYEKSLLPLLQRMISLEILSLDIGCDRHTSFFDGNDLKKLIHHLTRLRQFTCHIRSIIFCALALQWPSNEQIQDTFTNLKDYQIKSTVDYFVRKGLGQCHIYSNPYTANCYHNIANQFPSGLFKSVRKITLFDESPFEYDFFIKIAQAFPLIRELSLENRMAQKDDKYRKSTDNSEDFPPIRYLHLKKLELIDVHQDYLHLFLDHTIVFLPNGISLGIRHANLTKATDQFTKDQMRINCAKVIQLSTYSKFEMSEDFKRYFPNIKQIGLYCSSNKN